MAKVRKSWGFPRWGEYGRDRHAVHVRMCDFNGCNEKADCPAPKAPHSAEKWWFCQNHAGEYNRNWNYFEGMTAEEARRHADAEQKMGASYSQSNTYGWGGASGDDGLSRVERDALDFLDLDADASAGEIKARYREMAKIYHPDRNKNDAIAANMFQKVRAAYEALQNRIQDQSYHAPQ